MFSLFKGVNIFWANMSCGNLDAPHTNSNNLFLFSLVASNRVLAWIFGCSELDYDPIELFFLAFYMLRPEETDASMEGIVCYYFVNSPFSRFILWNTLVKSN